VGYAIPSSVELIDPKILFENLQIQIVVFENDSLVLRIETEGLARTGLCHICVPSSVEFMGAACFRECHSLSSVLFESRSRLSRIETQAFIKTGLIEIIIPSSVEFLGEGCFCEGHSLSSARQLFETARALYPRSSSFRQYL
jgi:hypothetical protein